MLVYHKTNGQIYCTEVMLSAKPDNPRHFKKCFDTIWERHMSFVEQLEDCGRVYVTGATWAGAQYTGMWLARERVEKWLENLKG